MRGIPTLRELSLVNVELDGPALDALGRMQQLTHMLLLDCQVPDQQVALLRSALPKCVIDT
jgi:hypothetical protein